MNQPLPTKGSGAARRLLSKRFLLGTWLLLAIIGLGIASQSWIKVTYLFAATHRLLTATGATAWPQVSGFVAFWFGSLLAALLTRGWVRTILIAIASVVNGVWGISFLGSVRGDFPPALASTIEKASGITASSPGQASDAVTGWTSNSCPEWFLLIVFLVTLLMAASALATRLWSASEGVDRYKVAESAALESDNLGVKRDHTSENKVELSNEPTDNISLWDSQK